MAFTDNSDLFGALHEDGINLVVQHVMRQRPSLFNYGTAFVAQNPQLLCAPVDPAPAVTQRKNPIITVMDPIPIPGTAGPVTLDFCFQLTKVSVDFHPGNTIALPQELNPPLGEQRFAVAIRVCAGLGCPSKDVTDGIRLPALTAPATVQQRQGPIVLPAQELTCFCLDLTAVGRVQIVGPAGSQRLLVTLERLEIVDIKPEGLEAALECYLTLVIQLGILPNINVAIPKLVLEIMKPVAISLSPTPTSPTVPNNPAIEEDQIKVFIDLGVSS